MPKEVDVVVLGLGTGGEDLALQLLDGGLDVVGVESQLVGGECPYWACIPTKMAIRAANLLAEGRRIDGVAGRAQVTPDWSQVAGRIRQEATGGWDDSAAVSRFEARGGSFVRGRGRLGGPRTVVVDDAGSFTARLGVVVATGSQPNVPPIPGLDRIPYWTTREAIAAETVPKSLIVLGGGPVGCELAQVFARFGSEVSIVEGQSRLLPHDEPEASELLTAAFQGEGIGLHLGNRVTGADHEDGRSRLYLDDDTSLTADRVLIAAGRAVDLEDLGLEHAGIDTERGHLEVDERMRAGEGIWAMGDVTGKSMFTHVALHQSSVIATDILGGDPDPIDYDSLPRVTFTDPEVASVGLTEAQARQRGIDTAVAVKNMSSTFRGWLHDTGQDGVIKLVIDRERDVMVGGTVAGPNAGETVGLVSLAVHERVPIEALRRMTYPFPTFHGGIGEVLGAYARGTGTVIDPEYKARAYLRA